ncbi:MAG: FhaA domain-containing protein [Candidatus Promineifilaceae bacterium]|nr:FhaA domain-containing protein [Candidatus Promineifilaceae bacterium]
MPSFDRHLDRFERFAQRHIERSLRRVLPGRIQLDDIAVALASVLEEKMRAGEAVAVFEVRLRPELFELFADQLETIENGLSAYLTELVRDSGADWTHNIDVRLQPQMDQDDSVRVHTIDKKVSGADTQPYRPINASARTERAAKPDEDPVLLDAFLIVQGRRHVTLDKHIVTIGRHIENDIVIESPTVSRRHAQIRWRFGRFVIYDLGSKSGTWLNGKRVLESILHPGDVIMVSDAALIYAEGADDDSERSEQSHDTRDGSTQVLRRDRLDEH